MSVDLSLYLQQCDCCIQVRLEVDRFNVLLKELNDPRNSDDVQVTAFRPSPHKAMIAEVGVYCRACLSRGVVLTPDGLALIRAFKPFIGDETT
jgi:hypothetical protein